MSVHFFVGILFFSDIPAVAHQEYSVNFVVHHLIIIFATNRKVEYLIQLKGWDVSFSTYKTIDMLVQADSHAEP